jgi:hypothetical protein
MILLAPALLILCTPSPHKKKNAASPLFEPIAKYSTSMHGAKVCILIPVTSRNQDWKRMEDSFLYRMALTRLSDTIEPHAFSYTLFVGYDTGDAFFDNQTTLRSLERWTSANAPGVSLALRGFENRLQKPGPVLNFLSHEAYAAGCDFMYRINDDTEFITPHWTSHFVNTLRGFAPPMRGVVGPTCHEGNTAILTHDFVHRSHLDVFPTHYPPQLTDWWMDDWISAVYGRNNTRKLADVVVYHHMVNTRYAVSWSSAEMLLPLIEEGRQRVVNHLDLKTAKKYSLQVREDFVAYLLLMGINHRNKRSVHAEIEGNLSKSFFDLFLGGW